MIIFRVACFALNVDIEFKTQIFVKHINSKRIKSDI